MNKSFLGLKYFKIYSLVLATLWLGLFLDSTQVSNYISYNQHLTNILVLVVFIYIYKQVAIKTKKLMIYGVIIAIGGELLFSLVLGMYTYRLENLPIYVPLGHAIVYVAVYYIIKEPLVISNQNRNITLLLSTQLFGCIMQKIFLDLYVC